NDEQNPASDGVPPDPGYAGHDGFAEQDGKKYNLHDIRKLCLWGTFMAGGAGAEYYFGYKLPQNDLVCEDFRSRDRSWDYCRIALDFFRDQQIPFREMSNADKLIGNDKNTNSRYCFAQPGAIYLVYLPEGGTSDLDLSGVSGTFRIQWFNPRSGGALADGSVAQVPAGGTVSLGNAPRDADEDWLIVVRRE
ncbi:MAG: putative collagen-binding domain-containing protein, partial [Planctomycetota bacterium]